MPQDFATIQMAMDSVKKANTRILVEPGTYNENIKWNKTYKGIKLIGIAGWDSTFIDGGGTGNVIFKETITDNSSLIDGFTVRNGNNVGSAKGAGIYVLGQVDLKNLRVHSNTSDGYGGGAGLYLDFYKGNIEDCRVSSNTARSQLKATGGGMYLSNDGPVTIRNSSFNSNKCIGTTASEAGGAFIQNLESNQSIIIENCTFNYNTTSDDIHSYGAGLVAGGYAFIIDSCEVIGNSTGGAENSEGGGMILRSRNLVMTNSVVTGNFARKGGAIFFDSSHETNSTFIQCRIDGNGVNTAEGVIHATTQSTVMKFVNCLINANEGAAIRMDIPSTPRCELELQHCTLSHNDRTLDLKNVDLTITNSILWNFDGEIKLTGSHKEEIHSSIVKGGFPGGGNLDSDPLFPENFNPTPGKNSPCFNSANPAFSLPNDVYGNTRPMPINTLPDIGAIEVNQSNTNLHVKFYHDENRNGIKDSEERFIRIGAVKIGDTTSYSNFRNEGITIEVKPGPLTAEYNSTLFGHWEVTSNPIYATDVDSVLFADTVEFGMALIANGPNFKPFLTSEPFRCNQQIEFRINISNETSLVDGDTLWLKLDDRIKTSSFTIPPDTINGNLFGWYLLPLYPGESASYNGNLNVPPIGGASQPGDIFSIKAWINHQSDSTLFHYNPALLCSYDPNDKLVNPNRRDHKVLIGDPLSYTIRFQNTGNDYAQTVSIVDTLDGSLDVSSFRVINTSHPEHLQVVFEEEDVIRFHFKNIFLPDSTTDLAGSHGYIAFSIESFSDVVSGTEIENTAHIYFDSNPAIVTNTTSSIMAEELKPERSFLVPGHAWIYEHNEYDALPNPLVSQTFETITVGIDTLINDQTYTILNATLRDPCGVFNTKEYLREEEGKIYRLSWDLSQELLMIDKNELEEYLLPYATYHDEVDTATAIVESFTIEHTFDGVPVKVQNLQILNNGSIGDEEIFKMYEDIGFVQYGLLFPNLGTGLCDVSSSFRLRCFTDGTDTLHFRELGCFESELIISTKEVDLDHIQLSPNPATDRLEIPVGFVFLSITDLNGRSVSPGIADAFIELDGLPAGYYLVRFISTDQRKMVSGRFVKL